MTDETNDKKLKYLKRGEVRTMEKDVVHLHEEESTAARDKIAQIRTVQEAQMEAERTERAKQAAAERERMEVEARQKSEALESMRLEREKSAAAAAVEAENKEGAEKEKLRAQLKEAQSKEEQERKKFLENIAVKSGEPAPESRGIPTPPPIYQRPAPPQPTPPSMPVRPSIPIPQTPPSRPVPPPAPPTPPASTLSKKQLMKKIVVLFAGMAALAIAATFLYWYFMVKPTQPTPTVPPPEPPATPPTTTVPAEEPQIIQQLLNKGYYLPTSPRTINAIIFHSGFNISDGDPYDMEGILQSFKAAGVAAHYLIDRQGAIYQLAPDETIAYHAGIGKMPDGRSGINNFSIGISLVYKEIDNPNDVQYKSLSWLVKKLQAQYGIPMENILGYKDVASGKTTPWNFDWEKFKLFRAASFIQRLSAPKGAEFILNSMTLAERIGQLFILGFNGTELTPELENFIKTVRPGGVILFKKNIGGSTQTKKLIQDLQKISLAETSLPLFVAIDHEGGVVSRIGFSKENTGQSEIEDNDEAYEVGLRRGRELEELGINLNLAPVLDSTKNGDFLHERSFKKSSETIGDLAKSLILGQKTAGILTAIKHFPGYAGIAFDPEKMLATLSEAPRTFHFQEAMEANPEFIMTASVIYQNIDSGLPLTFSPQGIALLKEKLGQEPLVITDDLSQNVFLDNFSLKEVVTLPIKAGVDVLLFLSWQEKTEHAANILLEAVQKGEVLPELIDKAALRILELKQDL